MRKSKRNSHVPSRACGIPTKRNTIGCKKKYPLHKMLFQCSFSFIFFLHVTYSSKYAFGQNTQADERGKGNERREERYRSPRPQQVNHRLCFFFSWFRKCSCIYQTIVQTTRSKSPPHDRPRNGERESENRSEILLDTFGKSGQKVWRKGITKHDRLYHLRSMSFCQEKIVDAVRNKQTFIEYLFVS